MRNVVIYIALIISVITLPAMAQTRFFRQQPGVTLVTAQGDTLRQSSDTTLAIDTITAPILIVDSATMMNRPDRLNDGSKLDTIKNNFYQNAPTTVNTVATNNIPTVITTHPIPLSSLDIGNSCDNDSADFNNTRQANPKYNGWLNRESSLSNQYAPATSSRTAIDHNKIKYNVDARAKISYQSKKADPNKAKLTIKEHDLNDMPELYDPKINRRNWLHSFNGSLQFSQAYISPNWYQGGNNNLNMLLNTEFNIKLNEAFHPNLLFETSIKYKLGMNSAPDDSLRNYSISEDLFQLNSKFGVRAAKRWFYSIQTQFKTQLFNGYKSNTNDLKAAFLSPGELNVGLGMTYNYANKKKTFTFDASVSPLSYNLKTCTNSRMDETAFDIKAGHKSTSQIGSSGEGKLKWCIAHNITLTSRLFLFSDYKYFQGDLENTLSFAINRFLSTQINVNVRYDSSSPRINGSKWHKFQMKEILSFGFAYSFKNL